MMKIKATIILILVTKIVFSQISGSIGIGYNQFANTINDYKRSNGATLHLELNNKCTELYSLSFGMNISYAKETYYLESIYFDPNPITKELTTRAFSKTSVSIQYPILLLTQLKKDKLFLITGISINIDNFILFGDNIYDYDYELYQRDFTNNFPKTGYGIGVQLGVVYYPINRIGLFAECKTTNNKWFGFIYGEVGIKIRITKRKKWLESEI